MLDVAVAKALEDRKASAHLTSANFDFEREGSLATFWRQATPGTAYWRGLVPMMALPGQMFPVGPHTLKEGDEPGTIKLEGQRGAAIWQFLGDDGRSRIALQMRRQGVRTLMDVDDLYIRSAPTLYGKYGAWTRTHAEAVANGTGYSVEMHRKVVPLMDGVITATEYLADAYADLNPNVYVCPNSILPEDWADFERQPETESLRIGYYGSPSHTRDWPKIKKALKWASRQRDVEISVVGFRPAGWTGKVLDWEDDLFAARRNLGHLDVGLAPITRNPWADGKSDLKALEYAMAGVLPVLEDAPPYAPWRKIGWPFMPSTEDEWVDVIKDVVVNRDEVKAQAAQAREYVLAERTIESNIDAWREAVHGGEA
jgi:hypothetical protein